MGPPASTQEAHVNGKDKGMRKEARDRGKVREQGAEPQSPGGYKKLATSPLANREGEGGTFR